MVSMRLCSCVVVLTAVGGTSTAGTEGSSDISCTSSKLAMVTVPGFSLVGERDPVCPIGGGDVACDDTNESSLRSLCTHGGTCEVHVR